MHATESVVGLEKYCDLVFSPLALPAPPSVDNTRLIAWMHWARGEGHKRGLNVPERGYEAATGLQYPWLMANVHYGKRCHVEDSFEREFPSIAAYARLFPVRAVRLIVLLAQRAKVDAYLHTDSDGRWGFRFYLENRRRDALYFCLARDGVTELPPKAPDWSRFLHTEQRHYARWPEGNHAFCVNSLRAAHGVESNTCELGERIACLVMPQDGIDEARLLRLLDESSARFGAYQIWHRQAS